jgi:hypothetical protein
MGDDTGQEDGAGRPHRSRTFFRIRVAVLLTILAGVLLYAWRDVRQRRARTDWSRTLDVAIVVLRQGPVRDEHVAALRARVPHLSEVMTAELRRYRSAGPEPFSLSVHGPVDVSEGPPTPKGDGVADLARHSYATWSYLQKIDADAGLGNRGIDARIYVVVRPARDGQRTFVEGWGQQGGRVGFVEVELEASMVDFALFVTAHELFHTLGASDKYDARGEVLVPSGLAEPQLSPALPQRCVELMARHRPIAPGVAERPSGLHELRVGPVTAQEIGWTR